MKKTILCLIGAATLFLTAGCVAPTHDYDSGGYYGPTEYQSGEYRGYHSADAAHYDRYGYWDHRGVYHRYPNSYRYGVFPDSGPHYYYGAP